MQFNPGDRVICTLSAWAGRKGIILSREQATDHSIKRAHSLECAAAIFKSTYNRLFVLWDNGKMDYLRADYLEYAPSWRLACEA